MMCFNDFSKELDRLSERFTVEESPNSLLVTVHNQFILPENKIVLPNDFTNKEAQLVKSVMKKGGVIL